MSQPSEVFSAIAVGFVIIVICTSIAFIAAPLIGLKKGAGKRTFAVSSGLQNYGYLAIPLIDSLFPNDGAIAVLFVHNIGVEIALWTFSLMLLSGNYSLTAKVFLKGPPFILLVPTGSNGLPIGRERDDPPVFFSTPPPSYFIHPLMGKKIEKRPIKY